MVAIVGVLRLAPVRSDQPATGTLTSRRAPQSQRRWQPASGRRACAITTLAVLVTAVGLLVAVGLGAVVLLTARLLGAAVS